MQDKKEVKLIPVDQKEHHAAVVRLRELNRAFPPSHSTMTSRQMGLLKQMKKDRAGRFKLLGEPVLVCAFGGKWDADTPMLAHIAGVSDGAPGDPYPLVVKSAASGALVGVHPYEIDLLRDTFLLRASEERAYAKLKAFNDISAEFAAGKKQVFEKHDSLQRQITSHRDEAKRLSDHLVKTAILKEGFREGQFTTGEIIASLEELKKIKKVKNAYITQGGYIVVETNMLTLIPNKDPKGARDWKKDAGAEIGEFLFSFSARGFTSGTLIKNLTYCHIDGDTVDEDGDEYAGGVHCGHPNLDEDAYCLGLNDTEVKAMKEAGNYYQLVDFLILFFSLFPQDEQEGYMSYSSWFEEKEKCEEDHNPYDKADRVWELYPSRPIRSNARAEKAMQELLEGHLSPPPTRKRTARPPDAPPQPIGGSFATSTQGPGPRGVPIITEEPVLEGTPPWYGDPLAGPFFEPTPRGHSNATAAATTTTTAGPNLTLGALEAMREEMRRRGQDF